MTVLLAAERPLPGMQIVLAILGVASMVGAGQENATLVCYTPLRILIKCHDYGIIQHPLYRKNIAILGFLRLLHSFADT